MTMERMRPSLIFPSREILDPSAIRDFSQAADDLGFESLVAYDHVVLGKLPAGNNKYDNAVPFQEPFVLFGYLSGVTKKIKFMTGVLIPTQRQTGLLAKQAADVQRLSNGRLILGVGVGNNPIEFEAMGMPFRHLGTKLEKQIGIMRKLWTGDTIVDQVGEERFADAGINPGIDIPIPIWMGGFADPVLDRTARIADGYVPMGAPDNPDLKLEKLRELLVRYGKDTHTFPVMGAFPKGMAFKDLGWRDIEEVIASWKKLGISHLAFGTQKNGYGEDVDKHIALMREFKKVFDDNT